MIGLGLPSLRFTSIVPAIRPQAAGSPNYEPAAAEKAKIARRGVVAPLTMLEHIAEAMLAARAALRKEYSKLHKAMLALVRRDEICRRLMSAPGVGPLVAITFKTAIDDPARIRKSSRSERQ